MPRKKISDDTAAKAQNMAYTPPEVRHKTTKDRSWEERQRRDPETTQVSYRGISRDLNERMKEIAEAHGLTVSQVAGLFLAHGLAGHEAGITLAEMAGEPGEKTGPLAGKRTH